MDENETVEMGIEDTSEAIDGVMEVAIFITKRLSDGLGVDDAVATFDKIKNDDEFRNLMVKAYEGRENIGPEIKDIDLNEGIILTTKVLAYIPRIVNAMKK